MAAHKPVVSYKSSVLYEEDVNLLLPGKWLNDAVITFASEFLEHTAFPSLPYAFLHPSLALVLLLEDDEEDLAGTLKGLRLEEKELLFLPINDNSNPEIVAGGSHWTLLVIRINRNSDGKVACEAVHLDSAAPGSKRTPNHEVASTVATRLVRYLAGKGSSGVSSSPVEVASAWTVKQQNGSDCGVHVLFSMETLAAAGSAALKADLQGNVEAALKASVHAGSTIAQVITAYRLQLLERVTSLSKP
jgi:sentrin-specific protease 8